MSRRRVGTSGGIEAKTNIDLYILGDIVDGGFDQTIEGRLNDLGHDVEISGIDNNAKVQFFTAK